MKLVLFILVVSFNHVFAHNIPLHDTILTAPFAASRSSSREPRFDIQFHSEDSPFNPDDDQESVVMPNKNGHSFLCFLPKVKKAKNDKLITQYNTSSIIVDSEKQIKLKTPDELLEALKDRCFLRVEGWWVYEFCYDKHIRQIHLEGNKVVQELLLGVYDAKEATASSHQNPSDVSTQKDPHSHAASERYHSHHYTNGTICDLTNQPRETEVRFMCSDPKAKISSITFITELSTCKYVVTVEYPLFCKHPLFQTSPVLHTINCNVLPLDSKGRNEEGNKQDESKNVSEEFTA